MPQISILLLLSLISIQLSAQRTLLSGKAIDYSGKEITFYTIPDPIVRQKLELGTTRVQADGTFSISIPVTQTVEINTNLEKYCGTMVVEPGKNYRITLPPFSLRTSDEAHSLYFKPALYWLGLPDKNNTDLNYVVRSFITDFNLETVKNRVPVYQDKSKEVVAEIIARLEQKYANQQNEYFKSLIRYNFAELEYAVNQNTPDLIIQKYFATKPISLHHPAYQSAFETLFTDFLRKQSLDIRNSKIVSITNSGNYLNLVHFFEDKGYKTEFAELVVLKGLNDGYYTGGFKKEGVIKAIEMAQNAASTPYLRTIANQIKNKLTQLAVGKKAPAIKLMNPKKEPVSIDQFHGKFVYLSFFNSRSSDCRAELDSLVSIQKRLQQVLVVVSVSVDDHFDMATKLWKEKRYSWELLDGSNQKQLLLNYNATITPAFYLIDPNGMLQLSQAPAPTRGFEPLFLKLFRDFSFKRQRN